MVLQGTGAAPVVNGIMDYTLSGSSPLQVGLVILNTADKAKFMADPLGYRFQGGQAPKAAPPRTYATDVPLYNHGEDGHSAGTFAYDTVKMTLSTYDADAGLPWGTLIAGSPSKLPPDGTPEDANEYQPADDTQMEDNGNYGVMYEVTVPTKGLPGESVQVLLDPRGVGHHDVKGGPGYNNAFQGTVVVAGRWVNVPNPGQPGDNGSGSLLNANYGVGIGQVKANSTFTFDFMPPGGATLPIAIVLVPAYVKAQATMTYNQGATTSTVSATPADDIITLVPKGSG
jgi:hypothetical protein